MDLNNLNIYQKKKRFEIIAISIIYSRVSRWIFIRIKFAFDIRWYQVIRRYFSRVTLSLIAIALYINKNNFTNVCLSDIDDVKMFINKSSAEFNSF